ncbi:phage tail tube protein [Methylorubrum extorquens]|uniref:phage tail tube protein n=1 Tax=Methylorubrum extorquens TaxID=408 RepID=UPI003F628CEF
MARRYYRKLAVLAKLEATSGTPVVPSAAADAMLMTEVTVTPLEGERVSRDLLLPYFGDQGFVLAGTYARIEGSVEIQGTGTKGTVPGYGPLLRACGLAELVTAGTSVAYKPVSANQESLTLYANLDGVNHALVGARGTVSLSLTPKQIPRFRFTLSGMLGPIEDAPLPAAVFTKFKKPLVVSKANTAFSIFGLAAVMESFNLDLGNQVEPRMLVNAESIEITDRKVSGTTVIEAVPLTTRNWYAAAQSSEVGALLATHGTVDGNIVEVEAAAVQIGQPTYGNSQGVLNTSLPLTFCPIAGDDEITIRVR